MLTLKMHCTHANSDVPEHGEMQQCDGFTDDTEVPVGSVHVKAAVQGLVQQLQFYHAT